MKHKNFCTQEFVYDYLNNMCVQKHYLPMIKYFLKTKNMKIPSNIVLHEKGITFADFIRWFESFNYPMDFGQCCCVLGISEDSSLGVNHFSYKSGLLLSFQELLICYDAYIKVGGFDIPKCKSGVDHAIYTISTFNGEIQLSATSHRNAILKFPNSEMRDDFYYTFKDLILKCKELL